MKILTQKLGIGLVTSLSLFGILTTKSQATVLGFDITPISNFQNIDQNYGDNVTATTMGNFTYGSGGGFTPNIQVSYGNTDPALWTTNYGSLTNVLFEDADSTGILEINFSADSGFEVVLNSFDLAAYNPVFSSDPTIDLLEIVDGSSNQLFSQTNLAVSETTFTSVSPGVQASELTIRIDARNLGSLNDDIAIDNINFSQVQTDEVPEPLTMLATLAAVGLMGMIEHERSKVKKI